MRFRYMDFARAVLFSLGLVLHAAWLLREQSGVLTGVHNFIHSFRMESFFVIAGFFAALMLSRYAPGKFLRRRLQRLVIPMIFCGLTWNTLLSCAGRRNWHDLSFLATPNYWLTREWTGHLWFLGTLIIYVLVVYGAHKLWPRIDLMIQRRKLSFPWFFGLVVVAQYLISHAGNRLPTTPWGTSWIIADKIDTLDYWTFFVAGYYLFHHQELLDELIDHKFVNVACVAVYWLAFSLVPSSRIGGHLVDFIGGANSLAMCGLLFWAARRYFNAESPVIQSLSDASYTVYLVHWPTMMTLHRILMPVGLPVAATFFIYVVVTGALSIGFHWYVVEKSDVLSFLMNGRRRRRVAFAGIEATANR